MKDKSADKLKRITVKMMHESTLERLTGFGVVQSDILNDGRIRLSSRTGEFKIYSYPDLITKHAAMGALFGEGCECFRSTDGCEVPKHRESECEKSCHHYVPIYIYHGLKAAELLLTQGQQASIEYIWKECGE